MARFRAHGELYKSDTAELHRVRTYDIWADPTQMHDLEFSLAPDTTKTLDLADLNLTVVTHLAILSEAQIVVQMVQNDFDYTGRYSINGGMVLLGAGLTSLVVENPSLTENVVVKILIGGD